MTNAPPPMPPYAPPHERAYDQPRRSGVPWWVVILIGVACGGGGFVVGFGAAFGVFSLAEGPENISVNAIVPEQAVLGEPFTIELNVTNTGDVPQDIHCIDFMDSYLDGFDFVDSAPKHDRRESIFGYTSYYFNDAAIAPGETRQVTITLRPKRTGLFVGDIDTCINNDFNFITYFAETRVTPSTP